MRALTRGHKAIRIASAVLIATIIFMILAGNRYARSGDPLTSLAYWALCFGLVLVVIVLALFDLRLVLLGYIEERRRALRRIAEGEKEE